MILRTIYHYLPAIIITFIILMGLTIRVYQIDQIPTGFFCDEASVGYNAYTILKNGKDEFGNSFPIFFRAFGEYKNPIQIYSTVPWIALFGLSEASTRLTSIIYSTFTILVIYFLTKELLKKSRKAVPAALTAAFFLAISPWHIHFSRVAPEGLMPSVFFTTLGSYFFLKAKDKPYYLILSLTVFCLAIYSYFPARIFIPLFILGLSILYFRLLLSYKKITITSITVAVMLLTPLLLTMSSPNGWARFQQVSIFTTPPKNETVLTHIFKNYLSHFSLDFLFLKGDIDMPGRFITRHSVRNFGELFLFQLPLLITGLIILIKNRYKHILAILVLWLILYPTGSMLTVDESVQATRSIIGIIPFTILSAVGFIASFSIIKKRIWKVSLAIILAAVISFSFMNYARSYFITYPLYSSDFWGWQYGPREIINYFLSVRGNYEELYMTGEFNSPEIFIKFYDPDNICQNKCHIGGLDKINTYKKQLFALNLDSLTSSSYKNQFLVRKIIYYPNQKPAFVIGEFRGEF